MQAPTLLRDIPTQMVNEQAAYGPFDLNPFIESPEEAGNVYFEADLQTGDSLPKGMICTRDGILTGIPAKGTQGLYQIRLMIGNDIDQIETDFIFEIKPGIVTSVDYYSELKQQIWDALEQRLPAPTLDEIYNRPITAQDIYHFLEKWGVIKVWDAFNLESPGDLVPLTLPNASSQYVVYDRGSCLVAGPKDLYAEDRNLEDGLKTARALAQEVYRRGWTIEMAGLDKFTRAVWVELQILAARHHTEIEILNYEPTEEDKKLFKVRSRLAPRPES